MAHTTTRESTVQASRPKLISQFAHAPAVIAARFAMPQPRDITTVPDPMAVRMQGELARAKAQLAAAKAARIEWERMQRENAPQPTTNVVPRTRVW